MNGSEARNGSRSAGTLAVVEWDDDDKEDKKPGLCCLQGCLAATSVGISFFVALPTGILLVVLSVNNDSTVLQAVGCVLIVLPIIVLVIVILLCLNQNKLSKLKFWRKKTSPTPLQANQKSIQRNDINSNRIVLKSVQHLRSPSSIPSNNSPTQLDLEGLSNPAFTNTQGDYRVSNDSEMHI